MEAKRRPSVGSHGASWPVVHRISAAQVTARSCLAVKRSNIVTDLVARMRSSLRRGSAASTRTPMASRNCASSSIFHTSVGNIGITSDASLHRAF
jgi:hypothetical protein